MNNQQNVIIIITVLTIIGLIIFFLLIKRLNKEKLKSEMNNINIKFNELKSIPLAFKLNKATYIAKINEDLQNQVESYRIKYDECQKHLSSLQTLIEEFEDFVASRNIKQAKESLLVIKEQLEDAQKEVKEINTFLDTITEKENIQRDRCNGLKDIYRDIKQKANDHYVELSFAYDGVEDRLKVCENLFSSFEEQIYANDFVKAQENLEIVEKNLEDIDLTIDEIPDLVLLSKGQIPTLIDEVKLNHDLSRQRGVYVAHISIDARLKDIDRKLSECLNAISKAEIENIANELNLLKNDLEAILNSLNKENEAFEKLKLDSEDDIKAINEIEKVYHYLEVVFKKDKDKYNIDDLAKVIKAKDTTLGMFKKAYTDLMASISANMSASTTLLERSEKLKEETKKTYDDLMVYKKKIDECTNDEERAKTQVVKLQIVLNQVEVKIKEYRLPTISEQYKDDLKMARDSIEDVIVLLNAIPLDIKSLNEKLKDTIDFVYELYNNVNKVVGMASMVEDAIVFGNKYRTSYPEVDAELSKAEFAYLNGEYTQSFVIAIKCIEKIFPNSVDERIVEYAKTA